jgi:integrase/recombinase XerD
MSHPDNNGIGDGKNGPRRRSAGARGALPAPQEAGKLGRAASRRMAQAGMPVLPQLIVDAGKRTTDAFLEFFVATIRNKNTRMAYARAVGQFLLWCEDRGLSLEQIGPLHVAVHIEKHSGSAPTVKQHLAAIRMLFDFLVVRQVVPVNPASSVRGPKYVIKRGKTPVLTAQEARKLLDSIDTSKISGLRDRAIIGVMIFSFARVGAVVGMNVEDYYQNGRRSRLRLHEKGGKFHEVPAHHNAEAYLDAYIEAAGLADRKKAPLFRTLDRNRQLTEERITRNDVLRMIKRRARAAGLSDKTSCHTFRATGITAYLENGGTIENAQAIAAHESPRTTKLYDRTEDEITLDEVERIAI